MSVCEGTGKRSASLVGSPGRGWKIQFYMVFQGLADDLLPVSFVPESSI